MYPPLFSHVYVSYVVLCVKAEINRDKQRKLKRQKENEEERGREMIREGTTESSRESEDDDKDRMSDMKHERDKIERVTHTHRFCESERGYAN